MYGPRIALPLGAAFACAIAALAVVPRGIEAETLLMAQDDPVRLADHALDRSFNADVARREIEAALKADDADLAQSFLDLARDRKVTVDPALAARVEDANSAPAAAARAAGSFAHGLITGEPEDLAGLAGTALGDLFVFGDIRDAIREGSRMAKGEPADELILGLAGVGIALTAGTYVSLGAGAPARVGVSVLKAARRTGRITAQMGAWLGRTLRQVVDWSALRRAVSDASITRARDRRARGARGGEGREIPRSGADGQRRRPRADQAPARRRRSTGCASRRVRATSRAIARLADVKGNRTRAILKMFGRGALFLAASTFSLAWWILGAMLTVLSFVTALKRTVERATERYCERRRAKRPARSIAIWR